MKKKIMDSTIGMFLLIGIIFVLVGGSFTGVGIATFFWNAGPNMIFFQLIFGGIGLPLFIIGIICLLYSIKRRNRINSLISSGKYIMAEVATVNRCDNVKLNGYHPYVVTCQYQDASGNIHMFRSRYLRINPEPFLKDQMVRVYLDAEDYRYYYVDIDEVLPNIIEH